MSNPGGAFIAIEGGEGAGKGSILAGIVEPLVLAGYDVLATREPGGTAEGSALRALLLGSGGDWEDWSELLLMTAARVQHVKRILQPAMQQGKVVICDRYIGSTLAYQGAGRGMDPGEIRRLHRLATGDLWPGLTLVLDIDPKIGIGRSLARLRALQLDEGRFEALDLQFHQRVRESFLQQAKASPRRYKVLDASRPIPDVLREAVDLTLTWLKATDASK